MEEEKEGCWEKGKRGERDCSKIFEGFFLFFLLSAVLVDRLRIGNSCNIYAIENLENDFFFH